MARGPFRFTILAVAAAIALATLAVWSIRLVVDVAELRTEVETRVSWLRQIAEAQRVLDDEVDAARWRTHAEQLESIAIRSAEVRRPETFELPPPGQPRDSLRRALGTMVVDIRAGTARASADLGEHWDSINLLVVVSLFFATTTLGLLVYVRLSARPADPMDVEPFPLGARQLSERLATVGTLATGVAHEINNPLTYVTTNLQLLREDVAALDESEAMVPLIDDALAGAKRVAAVVQGLDRLRTIPVNPTSTANLDEVLDVALADQPGLAGIAVRRSGNAPTNVTGDASILIEVFRNIIDNAAFAMREAADRPHRLDVAIRAIDDDRARISISDTGHGIDPRIESRIFEPFFTTREVGEGTGLGLYVCHAVVGALGGTVEVDSSPEGTTTAVVLPLVSKPPALPPG